MSANNPNLNTNSNLLQTTKFRLVFNRLPNVEYFLTEVLLPGVNLTPVIQPTPFRDRPIPGDKLEWSSFPIMFNVQESLINWIEIYSWMRALGKPTNFAEYRRVRDTKAGVNNVYSDASLMIMSSHNNNNIRVNFVDCWPSSLSPIRFTTTGSANEPLMAEAVFEYLHYDIEVLP